MHIIVYFLASLRETAGISHCTLDLPDGASLKQAVDRLLARYPALEGHQASWHFAINQTYADMDTPLRPGDTISIFPYIAGG
jgi:molybdopterin converting factor small subunit